MFSSVKELFIADLLLSKVISLFIYVIKDSFEFIKLLLFLIFI